MCLALAGMDPAASSHGASWMPNTTEWPSAADVSLCSLADVLHHAEDGPLPTRYYLSPTAAAGILRRAAKRGKALPPTLQAALESVARNGVDWPQDCRGVAMTTETSHDYHAPIPPWSSSGRATELALLWEALWPS